MVLALHVYRIATSETENIPLMALMHPIVVAVELDVRHSYWRLDFFFVD
jgi:hypothetical protein